MTNAQLKSHGQHRRRKATAHSAASSETNADPKLLKAIVRAQHWLKQLSNGQSSPIEDLGYNPKVIRQGLRLAFLAPEVAAAALDGETQIRL
jgi:site-specific DNA recombinase